VEIARSVRDNGDTLILEFGISGWLMNRWGYLAAEIAKMYKVPSDELEEILKKHEIDRKSVITYHINKAGKSSDELKKEIKTITKKVESIIKEMIDLAKEIKERQDISNWCGLRQSSTLRS